MSGVALAAIQPIEGLDSSGREPPFPVLQDQTWKAGRVTRSRLRRAGLLYLVTVMLGMLPLLVGESAGWRAAGIGLWLPGGGFIADGGWAILLLPLALVLFGVAFFAWFGAGMIVAPILVWGGSAALAAALAGAHIWRPAPYIVAAIVVAFAADMRRRTTERHRGDLKLLRTREEARPAAEAALAARTTPVSANIVGELSAEDLAAVRYALDRALQPVEAFDGFDKRDIFQTAAIRYQINFLGYALSQVQAQYTPNFHGYLSQAQRMLIAKYLQKRVWGYWVYESMWGHLNFTDWNPAAKDNIMLTGYLLPQLALYAATTGDQRFGETGALTFRLGSSKSWPHDIHSIARSLVENFRRSPYCLYPCEPNWIYPGCNLRGMMGLAAYDLACGTDFVAELLSPFLRGLEEEFSTAAGDIIPLRSSITGMPLPFPASDAGYYAAMVNVFAPLRARRKWAINGAELASKIVVRDGVPQLDLPDDGIDFGNYRKGSLAFICAGLLVNAREMGDELVATAAQNTLDHRCGRTLTKGVLSYARGSNLANATALGGRINRRDGARDLHNRPMSPSVRSGPLLSEVAYPDVLVAHATSDGRSLDLVLHANPAKVHRLSLSRLNPSSSYIVDGRPELGFVAAADGTATLDAALGVRTVLHIAPAQ